LVLAFCAVTPARGETLLRVANRVPGIVDAPVYGADGQTRLGGSSYTAQLFVGLTPTTLTPVGFAHGFDTGDNAGYLIEVPGIAETIPFGSPGATAYCQLRVWDTRVGFDYTSARASGGEH